MSGTGENATAYMADELLTDAATSLFGSVCTFDAVEAAEDAGWAPEIWAAVAEAGFPWIGLAEEVGGSGGTIVDAVEVLRIAGAHAAPIPLAETALLGGWLLTEVGIELPPGPVTVAPGTPGDDLASMPGPDDGSVVVDGAVHRVPWAAASDLIAVIAGDRVIAVSPDQVTIESVTNVAGEPRETVLFGSVTVPAERTRPMEEPDLGERLRLRGALGRTALMAGALGAMSTLTVDYTGQRQQFGRPVSRFQAVQQHLVWGAQDAAITTMAARVAAGVAARAGHDLDSVRFQIAASRSVADEAAGTATRSAHQAHGAMGMTREYALHHLSRRLWSWRREWSLPGEWPRAVGLLAEEAGPEGLYPLIAS